MSLSFKHPVLPHPLATKELQSCRYNKELKVSWLKRKRNRRDIGERIWKEELSAYASWMFWFSRFAVCICLVSLEISLLGMMAKGLTMSALQHCARSLLGWCIPLDVFMKFCLACSTWTSPVTGSGGPKSLYKLKLTCRELFLSSFLGLIWVLITLVLHSFHLPSCIMIGGRWDSSQACDYNDYNEYNNI